MGHTPIDPGAVPIVSFEVNIEKNSFVGPYRIDKLIGDGGFGKAYLAYDGQAQRCVVIKLLRPEVAAMRGMVDRFLNEARAISRIKHPHIVTVYQCAQLDNGLPFIVYEYLDGGLLKNTMRTTGPMLDRDALEIVVPIGSALHRFHREGIVHRDLKPDNIMLVRTEDNDRHPVVFDFGIAKWGDGEGGVHTGKNMVLGSPRYMAPEQALATAEVDARADQYSLGVILWECLTGERLWTASATTPTAVYHQQVRDERPLNPCRVRPDIRAQFGAIIERALSFKRDDRFGSVQEMILAAAKNASAGAVGDDAMDIVYRLAPSLAKITIEIDTAGRPLAMPPEAAVTLRVVAPAVPAGNGAAPASPTMGALQLTPPPIQVARPDGIHTMRFQPAPPGTGTALPASVGSPHPTPTTLGAAASSSDARHTFTSPGRARRRLLAIGLGSGVGVLAIVGLLARGSSGASERVAAPAPLESDVRPTAAAAPITIVTEPPGAHLTIDGSPRGAAPLNLAAPVGTELAIRAELAGYSTTVERLHVGPEPATVRVVLTPDAPAIEARVLVDAGTPVDAAAPHRERPKTKPSPTWRLDPDGLVRP